MFSRKVETALALANRRHHGQTRKSAGIPYFIHLVHVALIVARAGGDEDAVTVAVLHDILEDTVKTLGERQTLLEEIRKAFGEAVATSVVTLTEPKTNPGGQPVPWRARKMAYLEQLADGDQRACLVSAADKLHNLEALLGDLERTGSSVWRHFTSGPDDNRWFYRAVISTLEPRMGSAHPVLLSLQNCFRRFELWLDGPGAQPAQLDRGNVD